MIQNVASPDSFTEKGGLRIVTFTKYITKIHYEKELCMDVNGSCHGTHIRKLLR